MPKSQVERIAPLFAKAVKSASAVARRMEGATLFAIQARGGGPAQNVPGTGELRTVKRARALMNMPAKLKPAQSHAVVKFGEEVVLYECTMLLDSQGDCPRPAGVTGGNTHLVEEVS